MIEKLQQRLRPYAPLFLRLGLGIVFFLFGFQKLSTPEQGQAEVQILLNIGIGGAAAINFYLGVTEMLISISLLLGAFVRYGALLATLLVIMFFTSIVSKYGISQDPTLNRDIGLAGAAFTIFLIGAGPFSIDAILKKRKKGAILPQ